MPTPEFGVFLSAERPSYQDILNDFLQCETLGYSSAWISDHVIGMYQNPGDPRYECWTTMSALAADTETIKLGQLVLCNPFRHPSLMAKMSATLDSISGGRLILGLGTGWHEGEFKAYGYPFDSPAARVRRLDEAAQIIKKMWTMEAPSFKGRHYSIEDAYCSPKPVQKPHPPLMLAGSGEQLTLRTVARHADISNFAAWMRSPEDFKHKDEVLRSHCKKVGRNSDEITRSWACYVLISEDQTKAEKNLNKYTKNLQERYGDAAADRRPPLNGTPDQIIQQVEAYMEAGVSMFILRFMGENQGKESKIFAEEVAPSFT
ncbi:MAG: TIGR03560 family F420-dependent LLM class oxidoreductase [Candidatus Bathyarchaeota archaeon]|nr:TIGR03560 family F420-dependent LLM class oxidoreductase [Candidatus Bathyarchaeota archaeon]